MQRFLVTCFIFFLLSCGEDIRTRDHGTRLNSKDYPDKEERLTVFNKLLSTHTAIKDVEFDLFNVNGFGDTRSVPGATSRFYRYVVKVDPADVSAWCDFLQPIILDTSFAWQDSLVSLRKEQWACKSTPQYFIAKGKDPNRVQGFVVIVYKPEGIIFREVMVN